MSTIRDFIPLTKLGQGTYSNVYKVRRLNDNLIYALKKVKMNQLTTKEKENALNQIRILASIDNEGIVSYKEAFFDEKLSVLCIVMEYADGGDLHKIIEESKRKSELSSEQQIWRAAYNVLSGLGELHKKGILHRDLKCANIFKSQGKYKIGDLNVSKVSKHDSLAYTQTGTPYYASPEVWRDQPYDNKSDIWSFGCIIYEMACLKPPFQGRDMEELFKNVQKNSVPAIPRKYSPELWELISLCLQKKSAFRPSAIDLLENFSFQKHFKKFILDSKKKIQNQRLSNLLENGQNQPQFNPVGNFSKRQKLLQTIKLPSDLKNLKKNLPESNYDNDKSKSKQNKSQLHLVKNQLIDQRNLSQNYAQHSKTPSKNISANNYSAIVGSSHSKKIQNHKQKIGLQCLPTQVCLSPPPNRYIEDSYINLKSLASESKLPSSRNDPNSSERPAMVKYSDRVYLSDKKSSRKERPYMQIDRYLSQNQNQQPNLNTPANRQENSISSSQKRPITSMPRTEKSNIIKSSHLNGINGSALNPRVQLQELRKKLAKKNRVLSSNNPKPSWWS